MTRTGRTGSHSRRRRALVTFEWILAVSLLVIGIIGGLAAVRNSILCQLQSMADCIAH